MPRSGCWSQDCVARGQLDPAGRRAARHKPSMRGRHSAAPPVHFALYGKLWPRGCSPLRDPMCSPAEVPHPACHQASCRCPGVGTAHHLFRRTCGPGPATTTVGNSTAPAASSLVSSWRYLVASPNPSRNPGRRVGPASADTSVRHPVWGAGPTRMPPRPTPVTVPWSPERGTACAARRAPPARRRSAAGAAPGCTGGDDPLQPATARTAVRPPGLLHRALAPPRGFPALLGMPRGHAREKPPRRFRRAGQRPTRVRSPPACAATADGTCAPQRHQASVSHVTCY